jgi:hypothetical protein
MAAQTTLRGCCNRGMHAGHKPTTDAPPQDTGAGVPLFVHPHMMSYAVVAPSGTLLRKAPCTSHKWRRNQRLAARQHGRGPRLNRHEKGQPRGDGEGGCDRRAYPGHPREARAAPCYSSASAGGSNPRRHEGSVENL